MSVKSTYSLLSAGAMAMLLGATVGCPSAARATPVQIGVDFYGSYPVNEEVTGTAGYYAQSHWNNIKPTGGQYPANGSASNLLLSDGTASSASLSFSAPGLVDNVLTPVAGATATETQTVYLMNSFLDSGYISGTIGAIGPTATVAVTNIPSSIAGTGATKYTVVLYIAYNTVRDNSNYIVNGVSQTVDESGTYQPGTSSGTLTLATSSTAGNYVVFNNVTGTTLTITANTPNNSRAGLDGFQVIAAPEPATLSLGALGGLGLLMLKRRRSA